MSLEIAACLFELELRQRRVVGAGARDQHVIDGRAQLIEKLSELFEVGRVKRRGAQRADIVRGALETPGISRCENHIRALGARPPGGFEPYAAAVADHDDVCPRSSGSRRIRELVSLLIILPIYRRELRLWGSCVTGEDVVASFDRDVAGKAGFEQRLVGRFTVFKLGKPPSSCRGIFC